MVDVVVGSSKKALSLVEGGLGICSEEGHLVNPHAASFFQYMTEQEARNPPPSPVRFHEHVVEIRIQTIGIPTGGQSVHQSKSTSSDHMSAVVREIADECVFPVLLQVVPHKSSRQLKRHIIPSHCSEHLNPMTDNEFSVFRTGSNHIDHSSHLPTDFAGVSLFVLSGSLRVLGVPRQHFCRGTKKYSQFFQRVTLSQER